MAWCKGPVQPKVFDFSASKINKEIAEIEGFLPEDEAINLLYKFLRNNIGLASEMLLGMKLFPFQEMMIKSMMIGDFCMFVLSRGMSKCSVIGEHVFTNNGLKKIENVEEGEFVQSLYQHNGVGQKTINPKQKTWVAHTNSGYQSGGLDYHRSLFFNEENISFEWKNAKDFKVGDTIPIRKGFNFWPKEKEDFFKNAPKTIGQFSFDPRVRSQKDWYYFFGLLIGDGCFLKRNGKPVGVTITTGDLEIAKWIQDFVCDVEKRERFNPNVNQRGKTYRIDFKRKGLIDWFLKLGFEASALAHEKEIPQSLLNNSKENICALLSGLYDANGFCSLTRKKEKNSLSCQIGLSSSSEELIFQVQNLLLNLGAESTKNVAFEGGKRKIQGVECNCKKAWILRVCNSTTIRIFNQDIGFRLTRKQEKLNKAIEQQVNGGKGYNQKIPCQKYIENKYGRYFHKDGKTVKLSYGSKSISRPKLQSLYDMGVFDERDSLKIEALLNLDIYFDKIKKVEEGENITVDLQVDNENCYYSNGFINHNTWSAAIFVLLQLIFRQGIQMGVLSSGFRQARFILQKAQDILKRPGATLVKDLFKLQRGTDQWTLTCGDSSAIALPLADGSKLRGFRFQILLLDEFLNIPKNIFQEVILPFLGVVDNPTEREDLKELEDQLITEGKLKEEERYIWPNNKLILLSSPSYTFEYMYELYKQYRDSILGVNIKHEEDGTENFGSDAYKIIFQLSYDCAPDSLYDKNQLTIAKQTMSEAIFKKEYGGQFVSESDSYFRLSKMAACTVPDGSSPHVEIAGNPSDEYIISLDPSWSEDSSSDDFAMEVFKLNRDECRACAVHAYSLAGTALKKHIEYFHYLLTHFNVAGVVMDYHGGVQFLNACNESELFKKDNIKLGTIEVDHGFDKPEEYKSDLIQFKKERLPSQYKYCFMRKPSSNWIRQANELLQANIDHKRIWFAAPTVDSSFNAQRNKNIPIDKLKWDKFPKPKSRQQQMIEFIDYQVSKLEQTKQQCANIEVKQNPQGTQTFNLPQHMTRQTGPNKPRKDLYSALVLGNWMAKIIFDAETVKEEENTLETFTPFFV